MQILTPRIQKAIDLSAVLFQDRKRKTSGYPAIIHLYSVAFIVSKFTDDEDIIVAAFLHDVLEDIASDVYNKENMVRDFGERVTSLVCDLTEASTLSETKAERRGSWMDRKLGYLATINKASNDSLLICAADKIHNLNSIRDDFLIEGDAMWEKFDSPREKRSWFYEEVLKVLNGRIPGDLMEQVQDSFDQALPALTA
jgi:(p)ppGpp synthase/HD superfamily hydrolase